MIPYIIINGVSSKTINGLLIQSLPPISKPKIRVDTEEIDGRDGDIVTTLGYGAYDKTLNIGLHGEYNVDDVIKYFDNKGKVIFSNELDKYYNFAIYNAIDFARLIRFKTANVVMHVQPFKYSAEEKAKTYSYASGVKNASISVRNNGNIYSKPILKITGAGLVTVYLNTNQILAIQLPTAGQTIIIDVEAMNAYDTEGNYLNRQVTGDYSKLLLNAGLNDLNVSGNVTEITIEKVSRWI